MTLAQNRRQPLSGNKPLWLLVLMIISACSPKVQPVGKTRPQPPAQAPVTGNDKPVTVTPPPKPVLVKPPVAQNTSIALLLPFSLDNLSSVNGYSAADLKEANIAIDYYQGFRLALDSLTALGYNYKLRVFDTKDEPAYTHSLAGNPAVNNSNLIVGPVFPAGIKSFIGGKPATLKKPLLSPLAPASPDEFADQNLITINPPLEYHAAGAAQFVYSHIRPRRVFILNSGYTDDYKFIAPFKTTMDTLSNKRVQVVNYTVRGGNLSALLPQLSKTAENVFIVPAVNQPFLAVTLRSLDTLSNRYPVTVIGHPSWEKLTFLKADQLQRIKAHITSADKVDYRSPATVDFIRTYRKNFKAEPSAYAFKGFDEGMFFGQILAQDNNDLSKLGRHHYKALHNEFQFIKKEGLGWINTHVHVLKYVNFELKQVE